MKLLFVLFTFLCVNLSAQELHFSQPDKMALLHNPSQTGFFKGHKRYTVLYRNQGMFINGKPAFQTVFIQNDYSFTSKKGSKAYGLGGKLEYDRGANNFLSHYELEVKGAIHFMSSEKTHFLSIGAQGGVGSTNLNSINLLFPSQFDGVELDENLNNGETFSGGTKLTFQSGLGVQYAFFAKNAKQFRIAIALQNSHLNSLTYLESEVSPLWHYNSFINYRQPLSDRSVVDLSYFGHSIYSNFSAMLLLKWMYELNINDKLIFGTGYRLNDAFIFTAGYQVDKLLFELAYDFTTSEKSGLNSGQGGFEIALTYKGFKKERMPKTHLAPLRYY